MPISVNLAKALDKEWEDKSIDDVLAAPVAALSGVSDSDAEHLKAAFGITTVRDLGTNKYFAVAGVLAALGGHSG